MPNRVLGFLWHYAPAARLFGKSTPVSMPNRVLGFLWLPATKALLYLLFKVQFRESQTKLSFQPVACQYRIFHTHSKVLSHKNYRFSVNRFFRGWASNSCCT